MGRLSSSGSQIREIQRRFNARLSTDDYGLNPNTAPFGSSANLVADFMAMFFNCFAVSVPIPRLSLPQSLEVEIIFLPCSIVGLRLVAASCYPLKASLQ